MLQRHVGVSEGMLHVMVIAPARSGLVSKCLCWSVCSCHSLISRLFVENIKIEKILPDCHPISARGQEFPCIEC